MEQQLDAGEYRKIANRLEKDLEELLAYSESIERISVPVVGNLQIFPRLSPEIRTLGQQLSLAQDKANEAIEILNTLAELDEAEKRGDKAISPVPPILIAHMEANVMAFIDRYRNKNQSQKTMKTKKQKNKENNSLN